MKKVTGIFIFLMILGNISDLSAQVVLTCPLISYTEQGKGVKEISDICFWAIHENGNAEIRILKKGENGDMKKYFNDDIVYSHIIFSNRKEESEYDLFTGIKINGQDMDDEKYYCKLISYKLTECDYLMLFNVIDKLNDRIVYQVSLIRQYEGSRFKFSATRE